MYKGLEDTTAASNASSKKRGKHDETCHAAHKDFIPFAVDVCGMVGEAAIAFLLKHITVGYATFTGRTYAFVMSLCHDKISFPIQLGSAC
jgi:hypothetical protein